MVAKLQQGILPRIMPNGKRIGYYRADSACYQARVIRLQVSLCRTSGSYPKVSSFGGSLQVIPAII